VPNCPDTNIPNTDEFVRLLTGVQRELYIYILSMVPDDAQASDVLQNTNLVLWQKREEFEIGTNFPAWAATFAFHQVLAHRKRRSLDRHLFAGDLVEQMADAVAETLATASSRLAFLEECIELLPPAHRSVLMRRYAPEGRVESIAATEGRSPAAISQLIYRIRHTLMECVERKLVGEKAT